MKRKNTTRNALFTSIISLLLCVSMLVGTTFAWFTDSVVSGNNVIAAGNLDIELYNDGNKVTSQTNLFDGVKWEPGVVDYENFTIENKGNLALLYDFAMNWGDYNTLEGRSLTEILKVAMVDGHVSGDRAAAIAAGEAAGWAALDSWSFKGEMTTQGESKDFALIIYWEPSDNDNNYNVQNGKKTSDGQPLYVNLGINLQATQKMHEEDSFGKDYDSLANPWDGSVVEVPKADKEGVITITTAAELAAFAADVNRGTTYSGKTVKLGADINLGNVAWTAIGDCESGNYFQGTFDGQGHTIYNLNVDYSTDESEHATAGLFGWVDAAMATVKNVNIDGATVKGSHWVGVIAGYFTGRIENCSVNNATVIGNNVNDEANGDKVGGIVGYLNEYSYINNNTVSNSTITGNRDIGGIAGSVAASTIEMKHNKVADTTITYSTSKSYASAGEIVSGRTGYVPNDTNTATNVTLVSDWDGSTGKVPEADEDGVITITTGAELAAFAAEVNRGKSYSGKTVKLGADIDLGNQPWTPIGQTGPTTFAGTFDGNGKTLYNLNIDNTANTSEHGAAGLFGWIEQHSGSNSIKNLTINGVTINSHRYSGAVAGWVNIPVTNCAVKNVTINCSYYNDDTDGTKVGALVGYADNKSALTGNTVENAVLNAYGDVGGLAGVAQTTVSVDGNTVKNVQINYASTVKSEPGALASTRVTPVYVANTTENVTFVKSVIVSTADELAAALKSTDKDIVITLANNIDVSITSLGQQTGGSGEYKLAGEATETITLDLNGKKLNITTTYWSNIGAKNNNAVFTIKNGTMTSSQATGTWNSYDLTFSNCNYVIENVVFEKAVAFANAGKSTTLKNVTIKEPHDYYALWITAAGQTVEIDGLTINSTGRGIKIDEEYVGTPAKVTLKVSNADFNTVKKGAILVDSTAGADITIGEKVDISGVKADHVNAVWVDSDATEHANLVSVTGGTKINEAALITSDGDLDEAIKGDHTTITLAGGNYIIPDSAKGKTLTIIGVGDTVIATQDDGSYEGCDYSLDGSTVTFKGITINTDSANYTGYARLNATYEDCTINGTYTLYGDSTFTNCTLNTSGDVYNIWTWGAPTATFEGCTFNSDGKAMLLYGTVNTKLTINNCVFNDNGGLTDLKAAIEIGNDYGKSYELIVNNTVVNGYEINDKGISTGTTLWANKNSMGTDVLNVVVDGDDVY